jgi:polyphosphate glucokinase
MKATQRLHDLGQSLWLDNITRDLLSSGTLTGFGSAMIVGGLLEPMELGHLPYKKALYEDYVGIRGLEMHGKRRWRNYVADLLVQFIAALASDDVVLGGGNVNKQKVLPPGCRKGDSANAFLGGFRLWKEASARQGSTRATPRPGRRKGTQLGSRKRAKGSQV